MQQKLIPTLRTDNDNYSSC